MKLTIQKIAIFFPLIFLGCETEAERSVRLNLEIVRTHRNTSALSDDSRSSECQLWIMQAQTDLTFINNAIKFEKFKHLAHEDLKHFKEIAINNIDIISKNTINQKIYLQKSELDGIYSIIQQIDPTRSEARLDPARINFEEKLRYLKKSKAMELRQDYADGWQNIMRNQLNHPNFVSYASGDNAEILNISDSIMTHNVAKTVFISESSEWRREGFKIVIFRTNYGKVVSTQHL